jgi:fibronectin-binding autotransporter adhesin
VATSDTLTLSGNITQSGTQTFAISGPGTTIISGSNTYSGGTTISSGSTFITTTSGSALGSGALTVNPGVTFGGSGTGSFTTYSVGAALPATVTTVQVGNGTDVTSQLTLIGSSASSITNANLQFNLNTTGGSNELNVGTTALTLSGDTLTLNVTSAGVVAANQLYTLIAGTSSSDQYTGITVGTGGVISGLNLVITGIGAPAGWYNNSYLELVSNGSNVDDIDVVFVPEPGTWALMLGGLAVLIFWQRRTTRRP